MAALRNYIDLFSGLNQDTYGGTLLHVSLEFKDGSIQFKKWSQLAVEQKYFIWLGNNVEDIREAFEDGYSRILERVYSWFV